MKKKLLLSILAYCCISMTYAQTSLKVYQILQDNCAGCHSTASPAAGLDLQGTSAADVYNNVYQITPSNAIAASKGYEIIYPGRPDKSYAFRMIQDGFEPFIELEAGELGATPHDDAALGLTDVEKELLRQWIIYGAPLNDEVVDETLLETYYSGVGLEAFPNGRPAAPDPAEGFQLKMGPFFLDAGQSEEVEYYQKYELNNTEDLEITRIETLMDGNSSHHFILYDFNNAAGAASQPHGLRLNPNHVNVGLVQAVQDEADLKLPQGAAFFWETNKVLDFNSHYINYSNVPYKSEVYLNVYYQESGIAAQEMKSELIIKSDICIPNNGDPYYQDQTVNYPLGDVYIWAISGHTHKLGRGYKMWKRENGVKTDLIYDAACWSGTPGCVSPFYDYQHIPFRYFEPLLPMSINFFNGFIHEAYWVNDGPSVVCWGDTSDDEMMVLIMMYLEDITGVTVEVEDPNNPLNDISTFPNPMSERSIITLPEDVGAVDLKLFDLLGNEIHSIKDITNSQIQLNRGNLSAGMYVYFIEDKAGNSHSGKIIVE